MNALLSWRVWRRLCNPPSSNHIYGNTFHRRDLPLAPTSNSILASSLFLLVLVSGGSVIPVVAFWGIGVYCGGVWMWRVLDETHPYRFFAPGALEVTPPGRAGILLYTAIGVLHRRHRLSALLSAPLLLVRGMIGIMTFMVVLLLLPPEHRPLGAADLFGAMGLSIGLLLVAVEAAQRYAITSGVLLGLLGATFAAARPLLRAITGTLYAMLQAASALLLFGVGRRMVSLPVSGIWVVPLVLAGLLLCTSLVSEVVARGLWRVLMYRSDGHKFHHLLTNIP